MAQKRSPHGATETLDAIETGFERMASFIAAHPLAVSLALAIVLAAGAGFEVVRSRAAAREASASNELDGVQTAFLAAMGAEPGASEVPKLANPDAEKRIRTEYAEKYRGVAAAHPGTVAAALARIEVANLLAPQGDTDGALESLKQSLAEQPKNARLAGLVHQRIAEIYEDRGDAAAAAAEHEAAGALQDFPLRYMALADAARCYAQAGQRDRARELLERVESEGKDSYPLPAHLRSLLRELRSAQAS